MKRQRLSDMEKGANTDSRFFLRLQNFVDSNIEFIKLWCKIDIMFGIIVILINNLTFKQ